MQVMIDGRMTDRTHTYKSHGRIASRIAKFLWIGLVALIPAGADAASPEQAYLAARNVQIRRLAALSKPDPGSEQVLKAHDQAVAELQNQLRRVVGPSKLELPGLPAEGKINNDTLTEGDQGFGMLDGLRYASEDHKTWAVVTTEGLFKVWLREHRKWWRDNNVPQDPANALRHMSFYTQAVSTDAAAFKSVELPIRKPAAASLAFAMLGTSAQDIGPWEAEDVTVALLQGGKLYVVRVKSSAKIGPFPSCKAQWDQANKKSQGNPKREERDHTAFLRCFAERAPREKGFADLVRQAQEIADKLPVK
jgi:hypothetical protein